MRLLFSYFVLLLSLQYAFSQLNMADSSMQVVGYWSIGEAQSYTITLEKYKVKDADTSKRELLTYEVDLTVKDSTATSYTIEWAYKNYNAQGANQFTQRLMSICENLTVIINTDEFGAVQGVENWKEIRDEINRSTNLLKEEYKDVLHIDKVISATQSLFQSKEIIESRAIDEIRQFYSYHGAAYTLHEQLTAPVKVPNLYGGAPFDATMTVYLDELNEEDNNGVLRMNQVIDAAQISEASFAYLSKLSKAMGGPKVSKKDIPSVDNKITDGARIHGSGWPIYSFQTKIVQGEGIYRFSETIIEIK